MKAFFAKLVTGNFGRIKVALTAAAISATATCIAQLNLTLSVEHQATIFGIVGLAVAYGLEAFAAWLGVSGIKEIQVATGVKPDGYAGPLTQNAVEDMRIDAGIAPNASHVVTRKD